MEYLVAVAASIVGLILAVVVLIGNPHNPIHLLAWMGVCFGVALLLLLIRPVYTRGPWRRA